MSGGPGDGAVHETDAMARLAVEMGVPADAIDTDMGGVNTLATVDHTARLLKQSGITKVLAVSHWYHLPRIKMAYARDGIEAYTVPAEESHTLKKTPYFMMREVAALWWYYLQPLLG